MFSSGRRPDAKVRAVDVRGVGDLVTHNRAMHPSALRDSAVRFIVDSDPGRLRLRSAAATTLSLVLAIVALLTFTRYTHQPVTVAMLGAIVAMQSSAAVKDKQQHDRVITTLLLPVPAVGAVALAAGLAPPFDWVADVGFIIVLFIAVWVRRFGPPGGNALGMVSFMSYFFALFIHATPPTQIPILAAAVGVGVCATLFVRVVILPDRPRAEVIHLVRALRGVSITVLDAVTKDRKKHDLSAVRRRLDRLGETGLMIDDWLDRHDAAATLSVTSDELRFAFSMHRSPSSSWPVCCGGPGCCRRMDRRTRRRRHRASHVPPGPSDPGGASCGPQERGRGCRPSRRVRGLGYRHRRRLSGGAGTPCHSPHHHQRLGCLPPRAPQSTPEPEAVDEDEDTGLDPQHQSRHPGGRRHQCGHRAR